MATATETAPVATPRRPASPALTWVARSTWVMAAILGVALLFVVPDARSARDYATDLQGLRAEAASQRSVIARLTREVAALERRLATVETDQLRLMWTVENNATRLQARRAHLEALRQESEELEHIAEQRAADAAAETTIAGLTGAG